MDQVNLSPMEIDAIGEVLNISMGSAATAVSAMLDKQVMITTPKVCIESLGDIDYRNLEPALLVKITYTQGITGSNVMMFSQKDIQLILNQLMGIDDPISENFVFDELSMSAACEVMNQMMGSSATALSDFLGKTINISTPTAKIMESKQTFIDAVGMSSGTSIVSIVFNMSISGIMDTEFVSVMSCELAKSIVSQFMGDGVGDIIPPDPISQNPLQLPFDSASIDTMFPPAGKNFPVSTPAPMSPNAQQQNLVIPPQQPPIVPPQQPPVVPPQQPPVAPPMGYQPYPPIMPPQATGYPQYQQPYYPQYPQYGYPPMPYGYPSPNPQNNQNIDEKPVQVSPALFPKFDPMGIGGSAPVMGGNMDLIMNVPLNVSVEIGKTRKKIKDIMEFNQGTVIELEKQAGAPVDIVVNGQLFARGDVVVIDDNFGVRITEIIGTKELLHALEKSRKQ